MIIIKKLIGLFINIIGFFSRKLAARMALFLFTKPLKGSINEEQSDFLGTSFREELLVNGIPVMTYRWLGKGKKILLAHGWESNAARWRYLIEPLKKLDYTIIALDAPAHGRSGSNRFNALLYADFIKAVTKKFNPDIVIGHSVGGMATAFSQNKHEITTIKKLILLGVPSEFNNVLNRYYKMMSYNSRTTNAINKLIQDQFNAEPISFSTARHLESLKLQGLIIHDKEDDVIPYEDAILINNSFKNSTLITTKGLNHSMNDESISNHIYEFLES